PSPTGATSSYLPRPILRTPSAGPWTGSLMTRARSCDERITRARLLSQLAPLIEGTVHTVFYDGVCGLCNRLIQFLLRRDRRDRFRFAALQGGYARKVLAEHGRNADDLDTMVVISAAGELYLKARAVLFVLHELGGGWRVLSWLRWLPQALLDWGYD